jgi:hypothetical protein
MAEYEDRHGRVVLSARPPEVDEPTPQEKLAILWAMDHTAPPLVIRLDDGTMIFGAVVVEGTGGDGLLDVIDEVLLGVTPIPDRDSVYVPKLVIARLRDAALALK